MIQLHNSSGRSPRLALVLGVVSVVGLHSCRSAPAMPEGSGRGLLNADAAPSPGVETYPRPTWSVGAKQTYLRGGTQQIRFTVEKADGDGYVVLDQESGMRLVRDVDLAYLSEIPKGLGGPGARARAS